MSRLDEERAARRRVEETTRKVMSAARRAVSARGGYLAQKALAEALHEDRQARKALRAAEALP